MQIATNQDAGGARVLAEGQVWRTGAADIEVVGLGKRFIHYRVMRHLKPRQVSSQISAVEAMRNYLRTNQARLEIEPSHRPARRLRQNPRVQSRSEIIIEARGKLMKVGAYECPGTSPLECMAR